MDVRAKQRLCLLACLLSLNLRGGGFAPLSHLLCDFITLRLQWPKQCIDQESRMRTSPSRLRTLSVHLRNCAHSFGRLHSLGFRADELQTSQCRLWLVAANCNLNYSKRLAEADFAGDCDLIGGDAATEDVDNGKYVPQTY